MSAAAEPPPSLGAPSVDGRARSRRSVVLFAVLALPYGVSNAITSTVMPYNLRHAGLSVETIGWYYAIGMVPSFCHFLYAPLGDMTFDRRAWLTALCVVLAVVLGATLLVPPTAQNLSAYLALVLCGQFAATLMMDCIGGLIAGLPYGATRDRAVGWKMAGALAGNAAAAALALELATRYPPRVVAAAVVACMLLAIVAVPRGGGEGGKRRDFRALARDLRRFAAEPRFWATILLSVSPACASGLWGLFAALAVDFGATQREVVLVNGAAGAVATAAGSLLGATVCAHVDRRWAYVGCAALFAVTGGAMAIGPLTPTAYVVGVLAYVFVIGLSASIFAAIVVELMVEDDAFAATKYGLFMSLGNFPVAYASFIDSHFHRAHGVRAVLAADAAQNAVGAILLGAVVFRLLARERRAAPSPTVERAGDR